MNVGSVGCSGCSSSSIGGRLAGKLALVTGGSGGLGGDICKEFAKEGADIVIGYRSDLAGAEETAAACRASGATVTVVQADIGDESSVAAMFAQGSSGHAGRAINIVVAVGGLGISAPFQDSTLEQFRSVIDTNLVGSYLTMRHGATAMIEAKAGGKIITVSSVHGLGASHRNGIYSATKAGIIALTKSAAYDLAKFDIQVNCIAPGAVPVPKDPPPPADSALHQAWVDLTPVVRDGSPWGVPSDVSRAAVCKSCNRRVI